MLKNLSYNEIIKEITKNEKTIKNILKLFFKNDFKSIINPINGTSVSGHKQINGDILFKVFSRGNDGYINLFKLIEQRVEDKNMLKRKVESSLGIDYSDFLNLLNSKIKETNEDKIKREKIEKRKEIIVNEINKLFYKYKINESKYLISRKIDTLENNMNNPYEFDKNKIEEILKDLKEKLNQEIKEKNLQLNDYSIELQLEKMGLVKEKLEKYTIVFPTYLNKKVEKLSLRTKEKLQQKYMVLGKVNTSNVYIKENNIGTIYVEGTTDFWSIVSLVKKKLLNVNVISEHSVNSLNKYSYGFNEFLKQKNIKIVLGDNDEAGKEYEKTIEDMFYSKKLKDKEIEYLYNSQDLKMFKNYKEDVNDLIIKDENNFVKEINKFLLKNKKIKNRFNVKYTNNSYDKKALTLKEIERKDFEIDYFSYDNNYIPLEQLTFEEKKELFYEVKSLKELLFNINSFNKKEELRIELTIEDIIEKLEIELEKKKNNKIKETIKEINDKIWEIRKENKGLFLKNKSLYIKNNKDIEYLEEKIEKIKNYDNEINYIKTEIGIFNEISQIEDKEKKRNIELLINGAYSVVKTAKKLGIEYNISGSANNMFIFNILGMTNVNVLKYSKTLSSEMFIGVNKLPDVDILVNNKRKEELINSLPFFVSPGVNTKNNQKHVCKNNFNIPNYLLKYTNKYVPMDYIELENQGIPNIDIISQNFQEIEEEKEKIENPLSLLNKINYLDIKYSYLPHFNRTTIANISELYNVKDVSDFAEIRTYNINDYIKKFKCMGKTKECILLNKNNVQIEIKDNEEIYQIIEKPNKYIQINKQENKLINIYDEKFNLLNNKLLNEDIEEVNEYNEKEKINMKNLVNVKKEKRDEANEVLIDEKGEELIIIGNGKILEKINIKNNIKKIIDEKINEFKDLNNNTYNIEDKIYHVYKDNISKYKKETLISSYNDQDDVLILESNVKTKLKYFIKDDVIFKIEDIDGNQYMTDEIKLINKNKDKLYGNPKYTKKEQENILKKIKLNEEELALIVLTNRPFMNKSLFKVKTKDGIEEFVIKKEIKDGNKIEKVKKLLDGSKIIELKSIKNPNRIIKIKEKFGEYYLLEKIENGEVIDFDNLEFTDNIKEEKRYLFEKLKKSLKIRLDQKYIEEKRGNKIYKNMLEKEEEELNKFIPEILKISNGVIINQEQFNYILNQIQFANKYVQEIINNTNPQNKLTLLLKDIINEDEEIKKLLNKKIDNLKKIGIISSKLNKLFVQKIIKNVAHSGKMNKKDNKLVEFINQIMLLNLDFKKERNESEYIFEKRVEKLNQIIKEQMLFLINIDEVFLKMAHCLNIANMGIKKVSIKKQIFNEKIEKENPRKYKKKIQENIKIDKNI